jgi:site-specific recombinase XerD
MAPKPITEIGQLTTLADDWYAHMRAANYAPRTLSTYRLSIDQLVDFLTTAGMPTDAAHVTREHIGLFIESLLAAGRKPATVNQRYRSIHGFFNWLVDEGEIKRSPMERMKPPKVDESLVPVLQPDELDKLIAAAKTFAPNDFEQKRDEAIIRMFIDTGMRRGELTNLTVDDIDLEQGSIIVRHTKTRRDRSVPMSPDLETTVRRYLRARNRHHRGHIPNLWIGRRGALSDSGIRQVVVRIGKAAEVDVHPHQFRHTFAYDWFMRGGNETQLMTIAGWRDRDMLSRYARAAEAEHAKAEYKRLGIGTKR